MSSLGGRETLASYGIDPSWMASEKRILKEIDKAIPEAHKAFFAALKPVHETEDHILVHAGIRPGLALDEQEESDLLWIRDRFLFDTRDHGKLVIHGHTPVHDVMHCGNRVNIDTGAGFDQALTAVVIEGREVWVLNQDGARAPVTPDPDQARW